MSTDIKLKVHNSQGEASSRHSNKPWGRIQDKKNILVKSSYFTVYRKHLSQHFCNFTARISPLHLFNSAILQPIDCDDRLRGRGRCMVYLFNKEGTQECTLASWASSSSLHCFTKPRSARKEAEDVLFDPACSSAVHLSTACWILTWYP